MAPVAIAAIAVHAAAAIATAARAARRAGTRVGTNHRRLRQIQADSGSASYKPVEEGRVATRKCNSPPRKRRAVSYERGAAFVGLGVFRNFR